MPNTSINFSTASGNVVAANQTLNGTGTPGATVSIWNGNVQVANTTVGANGTWSAPVTLNVGLNTLTANTLSTLANFKANVGIYPNGNLVQDAQGNLIGTSSKGGLSNNGSVFELTSTNPQTLITVLSFSGSNGSIPYNGLIQDAQGNLFGTTEMGGPNGNNGGTVFELSGSDHKILTTLYNFNTGNTTWPLSNLVIDAAGNLFGATLTGGTFNKGTIFELSAKNYQTYTTVFNFNGTNGYQPSYLLMDPSGTIYGVTTDGGSNNLGTLFALTPGTSPTLTTLYNFSSRSGNYPTSLIEDSRGNLFGMTISGGINGTGTIFELSGDSHQNYTILYNFPATNLENSSSNLVIDAGGNLYGEIANISGGTIFKLSGTNYQTFTTLANFTGSNGGSPNQMVIIGDTLYGVTSNGGSNQGGTLFQINTAPSALNLTYFSPQNITITPLTPSVTEGSVASFKVTANGIPPGTAINYTISCTAKGLISANQASGILSLGGDSSAIVQVPVGFDGVVQPTPQSLSISLLGVSATETIKALPANVSNSINLSKSSYLHGETIAIKIASNFLTGSANVRISGISANYFLPGTGVLQADGSLLCQAYLINGVASLNLSTQVSVLNAQYGTLGLNASKTQMNFQVSLTTSSGYALASQTVVFNEPSINSLVANQNPVIEGDNVTFTLNTSNILSGTKLSYALMGLDSSLINNSPSIGSIQLSNTAQTIITIPTVVPFKDLGNTNFSLQIGNLVAKETLTQPVFPTVTWPVAAGGSWNTATNWPSGILPSLTTSVSILNSTAVEVAGSASAFTLTVSGTKLTVQSSAMLNCTYLYSANADLFISGSVNIWNSIEGYRVLNLSGGTITATTIKGSYGSIQGYGIVNANFIGANGFYANAQGSTSTNPVLQINGALSLLSPSMSSTVSSGATLELNNTNNSKFNIPVQMLGANATLKLDNPSLYAGSISSFVLGDQLDLAGITASGVSYSAGVLSVVTTSGQTLNFNLTGSVGQNSPVISSDGTGGTLVTFSNQVSPTVSITTSSTSVVEGQKAVFNVSTTNLASGSVLPYTLSGVLVSDIASGQLNGSVAVDAKGQATLTIQTLTHLSNLGNKTMGVTINAGGTNSSVTAKVSTSLLDQTTLKGIGFTLAAKSQIVTEGNSAVFTITSNSIPNGTVVQFSVSGNAGAGDYTLTSNSTVFSNGQATITIPTSVHTYNQGNKTLTVNIDSESASVTLIDNSPSPPIYSITPAATSVNEGQIATFNINTVNVAYGTSVNYTLSGVTADNIANGQLSGSVMIASPGIAFISIPTLQSSTYQGNKTLTVTVNGASASETLIDLAPKPTYTFSANTSSVNFGSPAIFQLSTTNVANATQVFYTLAGVSADSDLGLANLTGSVNVDPSGKATITIPTLAHSSFQGNKTLTLTVNGQSVSENLIDTKPAITVSANSDSVVEGNTASFTVSSVNIPVGTVQTYSITGTVASTDLSSGKMTGSTTIGAGGVATINIPTLSHPSFQGNKTLTLTVGNSSATENLIDNAPVVPDQYDGTYLSINKLMMGDTTYSNLVVTVGSVVSIGYGLPSSGFDTYNASTQTLTAPVIKFGNTIYTNVVMQLTSSNIIAQNNGLVKPPAIPPSNISLLSATPLNYSAASANADVTFTFSQFICPSQGNITITDPNGNQNLLDITSSPYVQISGNTLTVLHSNFYQLKGAYQFNIPAGIIQGVTGGNFAGVNDYSVTLTGLAT